MRLPAAWPPAAAPSAAPAVKEEDDGPDVQPSSKEVRACVRPEESFALPPRTVSTVLLLASAWPAGGGVPVHAGERHHHCGDAPPGGRGPRGGHHAYHHAACAPTPCIPPPHLLHATHAQVGNFELKVKRSGGGSASWAPAAPAPPTVVIATPAPATDTTKTMDESVDESLVYVQSPKVGGAQHGGMAAGKAARRAAPRAAGRSSSSS